MPGAYLAHLPGKQNQMPIYAYRCASCGHQQDVLQKLSDPPMTACPRCGEAAFSKQLTAPAFQLKGTGWYVTDFRDNGKKPEAGESGKGEAGKGGETAGGADNGAGASESGGNAAPASAAPAASTGGGSAGASAAGGGSSGSASSGGASGQGTSNGKTSGSGSTSSTGAASSAG